MTFLLTAPSWATDYYISPTGSDANDGLSSGAPKKTFSSAFGAMSAGDTLNIADGTYSVAANTGIISYLGANSAQAPSGSSTSVVTLVQATNPGQVAIGGELFVGRTFRKDSYIKFQGITFEADGASAGFLYNTSYVTVQDCGFHGAFGIGTNDHANGNSYDLVEDVWIWSTGQRIIAINYRSDHNVWRRVLVRGDGCGTAACTGSGNPNVGITIYDSNDISFQNVMVIDRILATGDEPNSDFACAQHTVDSFPFDRNEWLGCVSLLSPDIAFNHEIDTNGWTSGQTQWTITDSIAWGWTTAGFNVNSDGKVVWSNLTSKGASGATDDSFRVSPLNAEGGSLTNINSLDAGRYGINSKILPTYCNVNNSGTADYNQTTCVTGAQTYAALTDGSIDYIPQIESGSNLAGAGSGGADLGANVVKRYGEDGTYWGQTNYNALTTNNLWPWPNQDRIFQEMCTDSSITRGFCGSNLTDYIWAYLGNASPYATVFPDVSGATISGGTVQ